MKTGNSLQMMARCSSFVQEPAWQLDYERTNFLEFNFETKLHTMKFVESEN